jgi:hypothetical protein
MATPVIPIRPGVTIHKATLPETTEPDELRLLAQEFSAEEGGIEIDILCPKCRELIRGSYLPMFHCPHCDITIGIDPEDGEIMYYQQGEAELCAECGSSSPKMVVVCMQNDVERLVRKADDFIRRFFM